MIKVSAPPPSTARLRFETAAGIQRISDMITWVTRSPLISHVEAVLFDGTIIAALINKPVGHYPNDYQNNITHQILVDIPMTDARYKKWVKALMRRIGEPYDYMAVAGVLLNTGLRSRGYDCSNLQAAALVECGELKLPEGASVVGVSPLDLYRILYNDPRAIKHPPESAQES